MDTNFGFIRAIKAHNFNIGFGINGAIRKTTMPASFVFLLLYDQIVN
jgi:hypothetical protein